MPSAEEIKMTLEPTCPHCGQENAYKTWSPMKPFKRTRVCRSCGEKTRLSMKQWFAQMFDELTTWL